jgi:hypothetical protein
MENPLPVLNVYYCDVETGTNGITPGFTGEYTENKDVDPIFQTYGEYHYVPDTISSLCRDEGTLLSQYLPSGWTCPTYCLCGNPRILGIIDMGCYESQFTTGLSENKDFDNVALQVFPNPINSNPTIEFYLENEMPVQVSITDIHGRVVYAVEKSALTAGRNQLTFDTGNMAAGIYLCRLKKGNETLYRKMVKLN